jgi:hypothetical protein
MPARQLYGLTQIIDTATLFAVNMNIDRFLRREGVMRMFVAAAILASAVVGTVAQAQTVSTSAVQACAQEGNRQNLRGAPLADFLTKCVNTYQGPMGDMDARCRAEAERHVLAGEDLVNFMKRCNAGQVALPPPGTMGKPSCDERARERALTGDALSSFMARCAAGQV